MNLKQLISTTVISGLFTNPSWLKVNLKFLYAINDVCIQLYKADFIYEPVDCFPDLFFEWSRKQHCSSKRSNSDRCCNINHPAFDEKKDLVPCMIDSTESIDIMNIGGPVFRANDSNVDGFILYFDANDMFTLNYTGLDHFFKRVDNGLKKVRKCWKGI